MEPISPDTIIGVPEHSPKPGFDRAITVAETGKPNNANIIITAEDIAEYLKGHKYTPGQIADVTTKFLDPIKDHKYLVINVQNKDGSPNFLVFFSGIRKTDGLVFFDSRDTEQPSIFAIGLLNTLKLEDAFPKARAIRKIIKAALNPQYKPLSFDHNTEAHQTALDLQKETEKYITIGNILDAFKNNNFTFPSDTTTTVILALEKNAPVTINHSGRKITLYLDWNDSSKVPPDTRILFSCGNKQGGLEDLATTLQLQLAKGESALKKSLEILNQATIPPPQQSKNSAPPKPETRPVQPQKLVKGITGILFLDSIISQLGSQKK